MPSLSRSPNFSAAGRCHFVDWPSLVSLVPRVARKDVFSLHRTSDSISIVFCLSVFHLAAELFGRFRRAAVGK
jgi:hypothetical protein